MPLGNVTLRPPQSFPEHLELVDTISIDYHHQIEFKHPAYPPATNTLLKLPALDHPSGGLHYNTAKIACGIIAGNRWDGAFRKHVSHQDLHYEDDEIMPAGVYYFFVPGFTYDSIENSYPITPKFAEWSFPHDNLPSNWQLPGGIHPNYPARIASQASVAVVIRDNDECRVTGRQEQHETAHVIPVEEDEWFLANGMLNYVLDPLRVSRSGISDVNNQFLLRRDLHQSFDKEKKFALVPKKPCTGSSNMVTHLLSPSREYGLLYHNTLTRSLDAMPREYLPSECKDLTVPRAKRSGTGSPKKRKRPDEAGSHQNVSLAEEKDDMDGGLKKARTLPFRLPAEPMLPLVAPVEDRSCLDINHCLSPDIAELAIAQTVALQPQHPIQRVEQPSPTTPVPSVSREEYPEWHHLRQKVQQALQMERCRSDPKGEWSDEIKWALHVMRNEHSANDLQAWAQLDDARRILGILDDSRDWIEYEDRYGCQDEAYSLHNAK
ncbi:MAG: hypothetical protein Q9170_007898 [Blastenia crenularia]